MTNPASPRNNRLVIKVNGRVVFLDLDSIDAVDMMIKLQELTGCKVSPEDFKGVRTVGDVQRIIEKLLAAKT